MLKIHFLNVGKGNCTIIESPSERLSIIDIDNSRISADNETLTDPVEYFSSHFGSNPIFRFILTHPDMDHMSGLDALAKRVSIFNFWDTEHNKTISKDDWNKSPYNKDDWQRYQWFRSSSDNPKCLRLLRNATADCCWTQDGIQVLSPSAHLNRLSSNASEDDSEKYHHLSYVLLINYAGVKVLFGGDASVDAWEDILNECGKQTIKADIFLAPHHGSKNNVNDKVFQAIDPDYVIVSVARGVDYDHDYYKRLANKEVLSTKYYGTIEVKITDDGKYLPIYVEKQS
jgi:beta-lactamase superfamily II metal-dependent hydrolase